jgi:hypothetical protein
VFLAGLLVLVLPSALRGQEALSIRMNPGPASHLDRVTFDLLGLSAAELGAMAADPGFQASSGRLFRVLIDDRPIGHPGGRARVAGRYRILGSVLRFTPDAPIGRPPLRYRVEVEIGRLPSARAQPRTMRAWFTPPPRSATQ